MVCLRKYFDVSITLFFWQEKVGKMKANYDHTLLLKHMTKEFQDILNHISSLKYADEPNYQVI